MEPVMKTKINSKKDIEKNIIKDDIDDTSNEQEIVDNKSKIKKKNLKWILILIIVLWTIFSTGYIIYDQIQKYMNRQFQFIYQKGILDAVKIIINQATNCQKVLLQDGNKKLELIDASCK